MFLRRIVGLILCLGAFARLCAFGVEYQRTNVLESVSEVSIRAAILGAQTSAIPTKIVATQSVTISLSAPLILNATVWLDLPGTTFTGGGGSGGLLITTNGQVRLSGIIVSNIIAATNAPVWNSGNLLIENCTFEGNSSTRGKGGGLHNLGDLTIRSSRISRNTSQGSLTFWGEWIADRDINGSGGGIRQDSGSLLIIDTLIESNKTSIGYLASRIPGDGAIYGGALGSGIFMSGGTATLLRASIADNYSDHGERGSGRGGGIFIMGGQLFATNCTILRNRVAGAPGRWHLSGSSIGGQNADGGGIYIAGGTIRLAQCTLAENSSVGGAGLLDIPSPGVGYGGGISAVSGSLELLGSIVIGNQGQIGKDIHGQFIDLGKNVLGGINEDAALFNSSEVIMAPAIKLPGQGWYYRLPIASPARDIIESPAVDDILRQLRPVGDIGDAGSFEDSAVTPTIVSQIPERIILTPGSREVLTVIAIGTRRLTHELLRGENVIHSHTNLIFTFSGSEAAGFYRVRVTNAFGTVESAPFEVLYNDRLTFVEQPQSMKVAPGRRASFRVLITGESPMSFQWLKDGILIPGGTNRFLQISNVMAADLGAYTVRIRNPFEEVQSQSASLDFWPLLSVTNTNNSGPGSLRWAIEQANLTPDADLRTIVISDSGTISLQTELVVRSHLEIRNNNSLTLSGGGMNRIIRIETNASARLHNLMLMNGTAPNRERGGAIWNGGNLEMSGCTLVGNTAASGGAIYNAGDAVAHGCLFSGNTGIGEDGQNGNGPGGGGGGLGGAIFSAGGTVLISRSSLTGNFAQGGLGGVYIRYGPLGRGGNATPGETNNISIGEGGGGGFRVFTTDPGRPPRSYWQHKSGHSAGFGGGGGGAYGGNVCAINCDYFQYGPGSAAGFGGGNAGNAPGGGGGAGLGGALFIQNGTVQIVGSRILGNHSKGGTGLTNGFGIAGGIFVYGGTVTVANSIVSQNRGDLSSDFHGNIVSAGGNILSTSPQTSHPSDRIGLRFLIITPSKDGFDLLWPTNFHDAVLERTTGTGDFSWIADSTVPAIEAPFYKISRKPSNAIELFRLRTPQ